MRACACPSVACVCVRACACPSVACVCVCVIVCSECVVSSIMLRSIFTVLHYSIVWELFLIFHVHF